METTKAMLDPNSQLGKLPALLGDDSQIEKMTRCINVGIFSLTIVATVLYMIKWVSREKTLSKSFSSVLTSQMTCSIGRVARAIVFISVSWMGLLNCTYIWHSLLLSRSWYLTFKYTISRTEFSRSIGVCFLLATELPTVRIWLYMRKKWSSSW